MPCLVLMQIFVAKDSEMMIGMDLKCQGENPSSSQGETRTMIPDRYELFGRKMFEGPLNYRQF